MNTLDDILNTLVVKEFEEVILVDDEEIEQAKAQIQSLIDKEIVKARIDELEKLENKFVGLKIQNRLKELRLMIPKLSARTHKSDTNLVSEGE